MSYASRAVTDQARIRLRTDLYSDSQLPVMAAPAVERTQTFATPVSARCFAVVLALGVAFLVLPVVFVMHGSAIDLSLAELTIPGIFFSLTQRHT